MEKIIRSFNDAGLEQGEIQNSLFIFVFNRPDVSHDKIEPFVFLIRIINI